MITRQFLAASAVALGLAAALAASAHGVGGFICQTFNMAKNTPPTTHCVTWTREAKAMMRAAPCDPAKMSTAEMRERCAELSASPAPANSTVHG
jgi:hypothetical protein